MPSQAEVLCDGAIRGQKALGMPGGFEPLHPPLALAGGVMRVLGAVVQIPVLPMFHPRQEFPLGGLIALQFVRDDDPRHVRQPSQQFAEKLLRCLFISTALDEKVVF
jgi:hypothetical protein